MARNLTETLIIIGCRICAYDTCVALSVYGNVVICFHVDDLMLLADLQVIVRIFNRLL